MDTPAVAKLPPDDKRLEHMRSYAWGWFSFHADQRTKMFNFFVASSAFLVAGYATASSNHLWLVALVVSLLGVLNGCAFIRLDKRNEELVNYGKAAIREVEHSIFPGLQAEGSGAPGISVADGRTDAKRPGLLDDVQRGKHGRMLPLIESLFSLVFALGAAFACLQLGSGEKSSADTRLDKLVTIVEKMEENHRDDVQALTRATEALRAGDVQLAGSIREVAASLAELKADVPRRTGSAAGKQPAKAR